MTEGLASLAVLIPAYQPDDRLIAIVENLLHTGFSDIIVVNDGSDDPSVFDRLPRNPDLTILRHAENRGKGAALKTGFQYIAETAGPRIRTIVTMDADGQHLAQDVRRIGEEAKNSPESFIFGVRTFDSNVPLRSRIGNIATRTLLRWTRRISLQDTQTGLRAYPIRFAKQLQRVKAEKYDFEFIAILEADVQKIPFTEVPISTLYDAENPSSHFQPILDSMRIYAVFLRFGFISIMSFLTDILGFIIALSLTGSIYASTLLSRAASSSLNFLGNKYVAFRAYDRSTILRDLAGYFSLVAIVALTSAFLVDGVTQHTQLPVVATKIAVDCCLFISNFLVQRFVIFSGNRLNRISGDSGP